MQMLKRTESYAADKFLNKLSTHTSCSSQKKLEAGAKNTQLLLGELPANFELVF
jgi:hypothetical protein